MGREKVIGTRRGAKEQNHGLETNNPHLQSQFFYILKQIIHTRLKNFCIGIDLLHHLQKGLRVVMQRLYLLVEGLEVID